MNLKSILSSVTKLFNGQASDDSQASTQKVDKEQENSCWMLAGTTELGTLYVDIDKTTIVQKDGQHYLAVYAKEKFTDVVFAKILKKHANLKNVVGSFSLYLFDNTCSSYCVGANYLIDAEDNICLDYGSNLQMKELTAKNDAMLNAYTLCLKALELKQNKQNAGTKI